MSISSSARTQTFQIDPPDVVLNDVGFTAEVFVDGDSLGIESFTASVQDVEVSLTLDTDNGVWLANGLMTDSSGDHDVVLKRAGADARASSVDNQSSATVNRGATRQSRQDRESIEHGAGARARACHHVEAVAGVPVPLELPPVEARAVGVVLVDVATQ